MAGLIETPDLTKQVKNPFGTGTITDAKAFGYDPTLGVVNNATDTVSGQLDTILNKDNPYITRARASAAQEAQSRGLINSTMGAQAGESAAIGAALPIASQDANTYSTQRLTNQQYGNAASQFTAGAANTGSQFNAGAANQFGLIGANTDAQKELIGAQGEQSRLTQAQQIAGQKTLAQMDAESRAQLQKMQNDTTLSVADKQAAQSKYNADLAANTQTQMQSIDNAFKTTLQDADLASKATLTALDNSTKVELGNIQANYQTLMQTSASATSSFNTGMGLIQSIVADSTIPAANKATLINGSLSWMKQQMNLIGNVNGVDTTGLLNFSTVSA